MEGLRSGADFLKAPVQHITMHPEGRWAATSSRGVDVWDTTQGKHVTTLVPGQEGCACWFSPDGKRLAIRTSQVCGVWKVGSWERLFTLQADLFQGMSFSPDGSLLAVATGQGIVLLLDAATGREYARLEDPCGHHGHQLCFSPGGTMLVVCGSAMHAWDLRAVRRELRPLGLDWDLPPYPPDPTGEHVPPPLEVVLD
jgi:WD40 repeat protein